MPDEMVDEAVWQSWGLKYNDVNPLRKVPGGRPSPLRCCSGRRGSGSCNSATFHRKIRRLRNKIWGRAEAADEVGGEEGVVQNLPGDVVWGGGVPE